MIRQRIMPRLKLCQNLFGFGKGDGLQSDLDAADVLLNPKH